MVKDSIRPATPLAGELSRRGSTIRRIETKEKANDAYRALLAARNGERYDPDQDVWRLEFQLRREGVKGFRLYAPPEVDDPDEEIEAELAAEELQHVGTLPRFFARMPELFAYLTRYWLRLVETLGETRHTNRSRLPMDPTWLALREQFAQLVRAMPLDEDTGDLVRGARYSGKNRILRRLALGVVKSLEVVDASPTSAALLTLQRWVERTVEGEVARITAKCARYQEAGKPIPSWVRQGMEERFRHADQVEHRVQMLLGICGAKGVLPLIFKPAHSVGDLLLQHLDELESEAEEKGGVQQVLADHFAKVYKLDWQHRQDLDSPPHSISTAGIYCQRLPRGPKRWYTRATSAESTPSMRAPTRCQRSSRSASSYK